MKKYRICAHRFEGIVFNDYKYTLWMNKSFNNTQRMQGIEYGLDLFEKKERMSKIRFYFYKLFKSIIGK